MVKSTKVPKAVPKAPSKKVIKSKNKHIRRLNTNTTEREMEGYRHIASVQPKKKSYRPFPKQRKLAKAIGQAANNPNVRYDREANNRRRN
jgi:hypothetical protein